MLISPSNRRSFIQKSALLASGFSLYPLSHLDGHSQLPEDSIYLIGPQKGYTPAVGTLLSTMTMMRSWVERQVADLTIEQLDYQVDDQSNSIGAMLWHLAATERYYQLNTFDNMPWGTWSDDIKSEWDVPMGLGPTARDQIKGHSLSFYLDKLKEVRAYTMKEFAQRDDSWLYESEAFFENKPTNNYCKWFHVCEHESNHNGQIKFIMKRLPA